MIEINNNNQDRLEIESCERLIKMQERVKDCTLMKDGYHSKFRLFFFCTCDPDCQDPICEACIKNCHKDHWKDVSIDDLPTDFRSALCRCGQKNHNLQQLQKDYTYQTNCFFLEWSKVSKTYIYFENPKKEVFCLFCYYYCQKAPSNFTKKKKEPSEWTNLNCCCKHDSFNVIFEYFGKLCRNTNNLYFDIFDPVQFCNLVILSRKSFQNTFHNIPEIISCLGDAIDDSQFDFSSFVNNMSFMKSLDRIELMLSKCKKMLYLEEIFKCEHFVWTLLKKKFNYQNEDSIWFLKKYVFNIFHKINFQGLFEVLPKLSYGDFLNLNPLQRLVYCDYIKQFVQFEDYYHHEFSNENYCDTLLKTVQKYKPLKYKNEFTYEILQGIYNEIKVIARFNGLSKDQCMKFYSLNDELIYESISSKDSNIKTALFQMKMLSQMAKAVFYLAFHYNDSIIKQFLNGQIPITSVSLMHSSNETAKMIYRNCIHILLYCRTIYNEACVQNEAIAQTAINRYAGVQTQISKYHNKIMFIVTEITALTLNDPDAYIYGVKKLSEPFEMRTFQFVCGKAPLKESDKRLLQFFISLTNSLEECYKQFYIFEKNSIEVEKVVVDTILKIFEFIDGIGFQPPEKFNIITHSQKTLKDIKESQVVIYSINKILNTEEKKSKGPFLQLGRGERISLKNPLPPIPEGSNTSKALLMDKIIPKRGSTAEKAKKETVEDEVVRILINKTPLVFSLVRSLEPVLVSNSSQNHLIFLGYSNEGYLEALFRFLFYFVTDSPDNCLIILSEKMLKSFLVIPNAQIDKFVGLLEYILSVLKKFSYSLANINALLSVIGNLLLRISEKKEHLISFEHLLKIIKKVSRLNHLHQEHGLNKMRKIVKNVFSENCILQKYKEILIHRKEKKDQRTLTELIQANEKIYGFSLESLTKVFVVFLNLVNIIFDGNATLNETQFLSKIFKKEEIPYIIQDKTLPLDLRVEILRFFRMAYIDVIIDPRKLVNYYKVFIQDFPLGESVANFMLFHDLLKVKDKDLNVNVESTLLKFELKNFTKIVENVHDQKAILKYFKDGIIFPLNVFVTKFISIIDTLDGGEYLKLYEMVLYFIQLKKYLLDYQKIHNRGHRLSLRNFITAAADNLNKNKFLLIQNNFNEEEVKQINDDVRALKDPNFPIFNYKRVFSYFVKNVSGMIEPPKPNSLQEMFSKKTALTDEEILQQEKKIRIQNGAKDYLNKIAILVVKYENDKVNFPSSSLRSNLNEKNILYDATYREVMIGPIFYLITQESSSLKYLRQNLWHIFRLLQYDTDCTQEDILHIRANDIKKKQRKPTFDLDYLTTILTQNLLSLIFASCNPTGSSIDDDYIISYMIIKIMKYLCEDHNTKFQTIFFKNVKINCGFCMINMFEFLMCALSKIMILAKWDLSIEVDENGSNYFYEIFFVMIEFSIEMIQGTTRENLNKIIKKREVEKTYFYKFLRIAKGILCNNSVSTEILYRVRLDIINFVVAFLEEKNSPQKLINLISNLYNPLTIFESIVTTLKKLYVKYTDTRVDVLKLDFDNKKCKFFLEKYFADSEFSSSQEFEFVNRMYNYVKLLAEGNNKDAMMIINSVKMYNENELMELCSTKREEEGYDERREEKGVLIDWKFAENYFTVKFLEEITREVWIQGKDPEPQLVIFTLSPLIKFISDESKNLFLRKAPRENRTSKLFSLMEYCNYFFIEINHNRKYLGKSALLSWLNKINYRMVEAFLFFLTCVINVIIFLTIHRNQAEDDYRSVYHNILPIALCEIALSLFFLIAWMISKCPLYFVIAIENYYVKRRKPREEKITFRKYLKIFLFGTILQNKEVCSFIWHIIFCLCGITHPRWMFVFSVQLFIVGNLSENILNAIRAVTTRYEQLIPTLIFFVIWIYIFGCVGYLYFSKDYIHEMEGNLENTCSSLFYCFLTHMNFGLRTDGGIGEFMSKVSLSDDPKYFMGVFIFQFSFYVVIILVLLAIIGSIVIDTFAELREKTQNYFYDMQNVCFICNGARDDIEKHGENFDDHIEKVHNIWTYMDYMIGLKFVDPQETNAINSFVIEKIEQKKVSWFPAFAAEDE